MKPMALVWSWTKFWPGRVGFGSVIVDRSPPTALSVNASCRSYCAAYPMHQDFAFHPSSSLNLQLHLFIGCERRCR
ncbi:hypothetical protein P154DRAFT_232558 [Amniculicola lignicola CBS 123094]|uniref:Uncharacterized protein n=1 Tax=Amniculicola lignicola CBS 123094 TaxID=1392246 RepID=A0A6A5WJF9_9PLEO|nr:hypothetical protein P154DRAFT_232558 [Amniculicola lignicola CBS 123094]